MGKPTSPGVHVRRVAPFWQPAIGAYRVEIDWALKEFSAESAIAYGRALVKAGLKAQRKNAEF